MALNRFDVYLINLDLTVGSEIRKTRPWLVLSPRGRGGSNRAGGLKPLKPPNSGSWSAESAPALDSGREAG
jgi:hypothetical protein